MSPAQTQTPKTPLSRPFRRIAFRFAAFYLVGLALTIVIAWLLAVAIDISTATVQSAEGFDRDHRWAVSVLTRTGAAWVISRRDASANWGSHQVTGRPDTQGAGDIVTAWASASQDSQREWLLLTYPQPVVPTLIRVHETYNPGALDRITLFDPAGNEIEVWSGQDPTTRDKPSGVSEIPVSTTFKTNKVKIHLDSPNVRGWNEIDAVGLVDSDGKTHWAVDADASSSYGRPSFPSSPSPYAPVRDLLPSWATIDDPSDPFEQHLVNRDDRLVAAFGWPMLAMRARQQPSPAAPSGAPVIFTGTGSPVFSTGYTSFRQTGFNPRPAGPVTPAPMLPLRPIWRGLAVDAVFYAAVLWLLSWLLFVPRRFISELARMRRGGCLRCGYQLNYDFAAGCPECGWRRTGQEPPRPPR